MANVHAKLGNFMMRQKLNSVFLVKLIAKHVLMPVHVKNALKVLK